MQSFFAGKMAVERAEGFQRAIGKPFGRLRRGETLCDAGRRKVGPFPACRKEAVSCERFRPPAGGRGTFPHGKVPKGCRGRPKGACLVAAPGPPVAKEQCTASLAGARPAGFTSVPGRATVAFKVGFHCVKAKSLRDPRIRLWRKRGLAQLIPPPAPRRRFIPGVSARDHYGRNTLLRYVPRLRCHAKCVPVAASDWLLAHGQTKWRGRCGLCRSRSRVKHPSAAKKARRLSHLRAYFYSTYCHFST